MGLPFNVWVLAITQALAMSAGTLMVLVSGLFASQIAPKSELATLPYALMIVGTAVSVVPLTLAMRRFGRRNVFVALALWGLAASLLAVESTESRSFNLFCVVSLMLGAAVAGFQQIRFAAIEAVPPKDGAKAASVVLFGGLLAAYIGPELATVGANITNIPYQGAFCLLAVTFFITAVLFTLYCPAQIPPDVANRPGRSFTELVKQPVFIAAVTSAALGYALMSFIMTATPLHMHDFSGHSLEHTKWVIQSHIVAMFLPSVISGWLIHKLGVQKVLLAGVAVYALCIAVALSGTELTQYWIALVLLGVGWNFLFLGGTTLLPKAYHEHERYRVQAINEFTVFGVQSVAALSAGAFLFLLGWQVLLYTCIPVLLGLFLTILWWRKQDVPQTR